MDEKKLFISEIFVDEGPTLKRWLPRAMGRATPIQKKTSHITMVLKESKKTLQSRFVIVSPNEKDKKKTKTEKTGKRGSIKKTIAPDKTKEDKAELNEKKGDVINEKKRTDEEKNKGERKKAGKKTLAKKIFRRKSI